MSCFGRPAALAGFALALALAATSGCGDDDDGDSGDGGADGALDAGVDAARARAGSFALTLENGAFPADPTHPSAVVHVPDGFDAARPLGLVIYIHGFSNCVENIFRETGQACTAGGGVRQAYQLAAQLAASGKNAIIVAPEVAFDQRSGNPGKLGDAGGFRTLLAEVMSKLPEVFLGATPDDVGPVILASHSGGYQVAAAIARRGGVALDELWLLDSLYGNSADFDAWVNQEPLPHLATPPLRRFADVYTSGGGTLANSEALADRARAWVTAAPSALVDDRTTATWPDATYRHGVLFKLSGLGHDELVRYYFERLLSTSVLAARPQE